MDAELIQGQHLADSFLALLPQNSKTSTVQITSAGVGGVVESSDLSMEIKLKLSTIFMPIDWAGCPYRRLFNGDMSGHNDDHSAADLALVGHMVRQGLAPNEVDLAFRASKLYRDKWDEMRGPVTYGQRTIAKAFEGEGPASIAAAPPNGAFSDDFDIDACRPRYVAGGMPARRFVGPFVDNGVYLFPENALSALVALGAGGKTSLMVGIGAHVAAGRKWNGQPTRQAKVVIFSVEETQEELGRKFSALVDSWSPGERQEALDNLLLVSLLGEDARITKIERGGQHQGSGVTEKMIALINAFGLKDGLVILDHMQGFASGDLNVSETATAICREGNKIVEATGAAVVFGAHISKANIRATELEQGFAVGSLAFENATRQMAGMLPMSEEQARKFGLEATRREYVWLGVPKNSYGASDGGMWLRKVHVPKYHTVVMEPVQLSMPVTAARQSANEKLADRIVNHLTQYPWTTRNMLDSIAGKDGQLKQSKGAVRDVLRGLIDSGIIQVQPVTDDERQIHSLAKQVKEVLKVKPAAKPAKSADKPHSVAGLKPAGGVG